MSAARPSLAIVVVFVGRAPFYLPAFLVSCRANPDVQWLLYTDFPVEGAPPNVQVIQTTLDQLRERFSAAVGVEVPLHPKKICDLKPAYGAAFADALRGYDFWAHADMDVVWGDLRRFVSDERLAELDVFSSRPGKLSGHFTLFRNTDRINRLFERIPDMRLLMADKTHLKIDEKAMTTTLRRTVDHAPRGEAPRVYWEQELTTNADYQRSLGDGPEDALWWRAGRTFAPDGRELMYVHFHKLKPHMTAIDFTATDPVHAFTISRRGLLRES